MRVSGTVTGSVAGIVKIWDLSALLRPEKVTAICAFQECN